MLHRQQAQFAHGAGLIVCFVLTLLSAGLFLPIGERIYGAANLIDSLP